MIMPPLPCQHQWRPLFPPTADSTVTGGRVYRRCPECDTIAVWQDPYWEVIAPESAHRLRLLAAYLHPAADVPGRHPPLGNG